MSSEKLAVATIKPAQKSTGKINRKEQKAQTRTAIIDAAIEVFRSQGYPTAMVNDILKAAKVSRATFYAHFKDKADLAHGIARRLGPQIIALFAELDAHQNASRNDVKAFLISYRNFWKKEQALCEAVYEGNTVDRNINKVYLEWLPEAIESLMPNYLDRVDEPLREKALATLMLLFIQMERVFFMTQAKDAEFKQGDPIDILANMWWHSLYQSA